MTMTGALSWISITLLSLLRTSEQVSNIESVQASTMPTFENSVCDRKYKKLCTESPTTPSQEDCRRNFTELCFYADITDRYQNCVEFNSSESVIYIWSKAICEWMSKCIMGMNYGNDSKELRNISRHKGERSCLTPSYQPLLSEYSNRFAIVSFLSKDFTFISTNEVSEILELVESYKFLSHLYFESYNVYQTNPNESDLQASYCFHCQFEEYIQSQQIPLQGFHSVLWWVYIFQKYIEVTIAILVMILGILMSGTLLFIFVKHKEMVTEPNMIIISITICDLLSLTILYPFQYAILNGIANYLHWSELYFALLHVFFFTSAQCILALSVQRLMVICGCLTGSCCIAIGKGFRVFFFVLFVWGPPAFVLGYALGPWRHSEVTLPFLIFILSAESYFIILLPITVTVINVLTSRRLKQSAREMPGDNINNHQIITRCKSAKMVNILCFTFWVTHTPIVILMFCFLLFHTDHSTELKMKYVYFTLQSLFGLNAFLNPLIQFFMSNKFRELFMRYLFFIFSKKSLPCRAVGKIS